jgi:ABC-type amino acid transport system permease subunit
MLEELLIRVLGQTLMGSVIIMFITQKMKQWLNLHHTAVTICAYIIGIILGIIAYAFRLSEGSLIVLIVRGIVSALIATGGYDFIYRRDLRSRE